MSFGETPANSRENSVEFELKAEDFFGERQNHKTDKGSTTVGLVRQKGNEGCLETKNSGLFSGLNGDFLAKQTRRCLHPQLSPSLPRATITVNSPDTHETSEGR